MDMIGDQGGWLFAIIDIAGALALLAALIYGVSLWRNRYRDPLTERQARRATQQMYHHEEAEAAAKREHRPTVDTTAPRT
jgi:uncharacterized iron-regulated membrane protein